MFRKSTKPVRCPYLNRNIRIILEIEEDDSGTELLIGMTCRERDLLLRKREDCGVGCRNYFYSEK